MGKFIVIEGADGTGKSTLVKGLKEVLSDLNIKYFREPGGSKIGEEIRKLLLDKDNSMSDETEALLFAAMRSENYEMLKRELDSYDAIISDRFLFSSLAYQGAGLGLGMDRVLELNDFALKGFRPDLNIVLMLDAKDGIKRKENQKALDRLEERELDFHNRVVEGYVKLSHDKSHNTVMLDASEKPDELVKKAEEIIRKLIAH